MIGDLAIKGKRDDFSIADSALGTYTRLSIVTGATFAGLSQFSEVRHQQQLCLIV